MAQNTVPTVVFREFRKEDFDKNLSDLNAWCKQVSDAINFLLGSYGDTQTGAGLKLGGNLDLGGNNIVNLGSTKRTLS